MRLKKSSSWCSEAIQIDPVLMSRNRGNDVFLYFACPNLKYLCPTSVQTAPEIRVVKDGLVEGSECCVTSVRR